MDCCSIDKMGQSDLQRVRFTRDDSGGKIFNEYNRVVAVRHVTPAQSAATA